MSSYVNLLQPGEIRRHSVATDKRLLAKIAMLVFLLLGSYGGYIAWRAVEEAKTSRGMLVEWDGVKAHHAELTKQRGALVKIQGQEKYLSSWSTSRMSLTAVLLELASLIQPTVQIVQLQITCHLNGIDAGAPRAAAGAGPGPERIYRLNLRGLAHGASGEQDIFALDERIKKSPLLSGAMASVRLFGTQKVSPDGSPLPTPAPAESEAASAMAFNIECEFKPRALAWPGKN